MTKTVKFIILFLSLAIGSLTTFAQEINTNINTKDSANIENPERTNPHPDRIKIYKGKAVLDQGPEFPGGDKAMLELFDKNFVYPAKCIRENIQGRVIVEFVVNEEGTVGDIKIYRSAHPALDSAAIRFVELMPDWSPAIYLGKPVKMTYYFPVTFKLTDGVNIDKDDKADFNKFLTRGNKMLKKGNMGSAYYNFKKCFNIKPTESYLLDKIETTLAGQPEIQEKFYNWATERMLRDAENNGWKNSDDLIDNMIKLQTKLLDRYPNDTGILLDIEYLYLKKDDFDNVLATAQKIYPLIAKENLSLFTSAASMEATSRLHKEDYQGIVNLIAPQVENLLAIEVRKCDFFVIFQLLDSYIRLDQKDNAKNLLDKVKATFPDDFDKIVKLYAEEFDEAKDTIIELSK